MWARKIKPATDNTNKSKQPRQQTRQSFLPWLQGSAYLIRRADFPFRQVAQAVQMMFCTKYKEWGAVDSAECEMELNLSNVQCPMSNA
jgi:hypothetical protein